MFSEEVVLGGLKAGPSWFISDHLLRRDSTTDDPAGVAGEDDHRHDLHCEGGHQSGVDGYTLSRLDEARLSYSHYSSTGGGLRSLHLRAYSRRALARITCPISGNQPVIFIEALSVP